MTLLRSVLSLSVAATPVTVPVGAAIANVGATVHEYPAVQVPVPAGGAAIIIAGVVHVPVPPKVIPVTTHPATVAVAVTVLGQPVRVTVGAVVYPVPPVVMDAVRSAGVVPVTVAVA